jgi:hypothetical protein
VRIRADIEASTYRDAVLRIGCTTWQQILRGSLPFYRWSLAAPRPIPRYPATLDHIGHHILKRRLDLGLQQKETARQLGVHPGGLENWEYGRTTPADRFMPAVIRFLGYSPLPAATTTGERVTFARIARGWSRKRLAAMNSREDLDTRPPRLSMPCKVLYECEALLRFLTRNILVGVFFLTLGCTHWSGVPVNAALDQPANLRLHLRDGSIVIVRNATVRADSIVGVPWGSAPLGSRVAVARTQVERVDVGETDELRTTGLVVGVLVVALGALAWLARAAIAGEGHP